jgi:hypothetical protein
LSPYRKPTERQKTLPITPSPLFPKERGGAEKSYQQLFFYILKNIFYNKQVIKKPPRGLNQLRRKNITGKSWAKGGNESLRRQTILPLRKIFFLGGRGVWL